MYDTPREAGCHLNGDVLRAPLAGLASAQDQHSHLVSRSTQVQCSVCRAKTKFQCLCGFNICSPAKPLGSVNKSCYVSHLIEVAQGDFRSGRGRNAELTLSIVPDFVDSD